MNTIRVLAGSLFLICVSALLLGLVFAAIMRQVDKDSERRWLERRNKALKDYFEERENQ